jgi:hypothetical protein
MTKSRFMSRVSLSALLILGASLAAAQSVTLGPVTRHAGAGTGNVLQTCAIPADATDSQIGAAVRTCRLAVPNGASYTLKVQGTATAPPAQPTCTTPKPDDVVTTVACPAGQVGGGIRTTTTYVADAYPTCWKLASFSMFDGSCTPAPVTTWQRVAGEGAAFDIPAGNIVRFGAGSAWIERNASGSGTCSIAYFGGRDPAMNVLKSCESMPGSVTTTTPSTPTTPTTPTTPVPTGSPVTIYLSDCQAGAAAGCVAGNNANPGTEASPKQTLAGLNLDSLAGGSQILFKRGGAWNHATTVRLSNRNTTAAAPLTFSAYGAGSDPLLTVSPAYGFEFGEWQSTTPNRGYVFRGLNFVRSAAGSPESVAIWLRGSVSDVVIEGNRFSDFFIPLRGQGGQDVRRISVLNNLFVRNRSMGVNGTFNDSIFEGNTFEANNITGSGFEHGTYLSNSTGLTLRNNRYIRNSVNASGVCTGGNMTFHGQMSDVLIEGNTIEQDRADAGCWLMSITQGYATAEWFRNFVVRNNRLINGGNTALAAQSAPGIVIEGNVVINTNPTNQVAFSVGHTDYPNGDVPDGNAVVRNNTVCRANGAAGAAVVFRNNPGAVDSGNTVVIGAAATQGVCAR